MAAEDVVVCTIKVYHWSRMFQIEVKWDTDDLARGGTLRHTIGPEDFKGNACTWRMIRVMRMIRVEQDYPGMYNV